MTTYLPGFREHDALGDEHEGASLGRLYTATGRSVVGEETGALVKKTLYIEEFGL